MLVGQKPLSDELRQKFKDLKKKDLGILACDAPKLNICAAKRKADGASVAPHREHNQRPIYRQAAMCAFGRYAKLHLPFLGTRGDRAGYPCGPWTLHIISG